MTTRRDFIKKLAIGTTALSIGGVLPGFSAKSYKKIIGANERIRIGAIGVNSRGFALADGFTSEKDFEKFKVRLKGHLNLYKEDEIYYSDPFNRELTGEPIH